jgi:transposase
MSGIRFTDEFKRDAVAQVVDWGYSVATGPERLGISTKSLYTWKAHFSQPRKQIIETTEQCDHEAVRFSVSLMASFSSLNCVPSMTFGNWFLPLSRNHFFDVA